MGVLSSVGTGLRKVFGSRNERIVKRYRNIAEAVGQYEQELRGNYDAEFEMPHTFDDDEDSEVFSDLDF